MVMDSVGNNVNIVACIVDGIVNLGVQGIVCTILWLSF